MKLSLKQQAMLQVLKIVASGILVGAVTVVILNYFSIQTVLTGLAVAFVAYMLYLFYGITLAQLEYKETLKQMVEKKD